VADGLEMAGISRKIVVRLLAGLVLQENAIEIGTLPPRNVVDGHIFPLRAFEAGCRRLALTDGLFSHLRNTGLACGQGFFAGRRDLLDSAERRPNFGMVEAGGGVGTVSLANVAICYGQDTPFRGRRGGTDGRSGLAAGRVQWCAFVLIASEKAGAKLSARSRAPTWLRWWLSA